RTLGIVERKTTIPILNNILLSAADNKIRMVATDREIGLIADYEATVTVPGEITVAARKLSEMLREIEGNVIDFKKLDNNWVNITCDKVVYRIPGIPADDYPEVVEEGNEGFFRIKSDMLKEMISKTIFAVSTDEMRPGLNGVFFECKKGKIEMVATDGHRLSIANMDIGDEDSIHEDVEGIIIPRKGVSEIRKLIEDGSDYVEMAIRDRRVCVFKKDSTILRVSLIDADYPDYKKIMPKDEGTEIHIDRDQMLHSLKRMGVMSSERFSGVKIEVKGGKILLSSINPDVGEAKDEIDISYQGENLEVGYNVRYLIDAIEVISEASISFRMRGKEGPGVIKPIGSENYMCIVMPVKLREE
ncbi:MAG: DNA polymerase III subunit beta, partial [Syntrophobacterales bacterium]